MGTDFIRLSVIRAIVRL